jgi:hypothetical protein
MQGKRNLDRKMTNKNRSLLLFGFLYGQITTAVLVVTGVLYYLGKDGGSSVCASFGFELIGCRAVAALVIVLAFLLSGIVGVWGIKRGSN